MSHELRTPLNSLLILSDQLCKNPEGNLISKQIDFAKTIHASGNDLLTLINDILDLSKIESGTVVVDVGDLRLDDLGHYLERTFMHVAEAKNVDFLVHLDPRLPESMVTDAKRLQQILKNLLSNAFKFTHQGQVTLAIAPAHAGWTPEHEALNHAQHVLAFSVTDTGIGISPDKQQIIFEAFQQADGSTSRKYGGTGLGLAISRELAKLLGGEIRLASSPGRGSTFILYLPHTYAPPHAGRSKPVTSMESGAAAPVPAVAADHVYPQWQPDNLTALFNAEAKSIPAIAPPAPEPTSLVNAAGDDRDLIRPGDLVLLIVENDVTFARFLLDTAREKGFKGLVASLGADALALTREYQPVAVTLDIFLPDMEGWRVLDRLKNDLMTRHIPVCVISTDDSRERALRSGALGFISKPIQGKDVLEQALDSLKDYARRTVKSLLVVMPDSEARGNLLCHLDGADVQITTVTDGQQALQMLRERQIDCIVLDEEVPDIGPAMMAEAIPQAAMANQIPGQMAVILYHQQRTLGDTAASDSPWYHCKETFMVREVRSLNRLLDQAAFFLHRNIAQLPEDRRQALEDLYQSKKVLAGKKVLIVDDDMRNIFALAAVLDEQGMVVLSADNGREAIRIVQADPSIHIVLMDIMMPEMDGIVTIQEIRKIPSCRDLPIIAVTAKAMKGDRERCIEAGAWDYLAKPVDTLHLLAVLRAWLQR